MPVGKKGNADSSSFQKHANIKQTGKRLANVSRAANPYFIFLKHDPLRKLAVEGNAALVSRPVDQTDAQPMFDHKTTLQSSSNNDSPAG